MLGAIVGDIIGSVYEFNNHRSKTFPLFRQDCFFTDDTILTVAIADALLQQKPYVEAIKAYYYRYPDAGYGGRFRRWAESDELSPYNSWGNGSAMRVSPVAYAFDDLASVLTEAERSAAVTHNHPEGIKGAQATAAAIFLARSGKDKAAIKTYIETHFGYNLQATVDEIRPHYVFNESCQETVPQAIIAFLESADFEDAIRNAISLGGDSDTLACITGSIAEAYYGGVPEPIAQEALKRLDLPLKQVFERFTAQHLA